MVLGVGRLGIVDVPEPDPQCFGQLPLRERERAE